jgi:hypothetical protein
MTKYDKIVGTIVGEMMKHIKSGSEEEEFFYTTIRDHRPFEDTNYDDEEDFASEVVEVSFTVNRDADFGIPFVLDAGETDPQIDFTLDLSKGVGAESYQEIRLELNDAVRHELEHITQNRMPTKNLQNSSQGDALSFVDYLTLPHEVPAYVSGLNRKRKLSKREGLASIIDGYLSKNRFAFADGKEDREIEFVRDTWLQWANKNLPNTPL